MTARIRPDGEGYAAAVPDSRDRALEAAQLDRVEFVIGKINGEQRRIDQAQAGGRVVISRSIELPEHVIGLFHLQRLFGDTLDMVVRIGRTCECAIQTRGAIDHQAEKVPRQPETCRLLGRGGSPFPVAQSDDLHEQPTPEQVSTVDAFWKARYG